MIKFFFGGGDNFYSLLCTSNIIQLCLAIGLSLPIQQFKKHQCHILHEKPKPRLT